MANAKSLSGLIKFIHRTGWSDELDAVLAQHLEPACHKLGIETDEIAEILGEHHGMTLWGCALEDLMAREYEGGRNVVDEYLKRRGYAESGGAKRYMQALRCAVMSLYEVSDVVPGQSFLARDMIRGGGPVRVIEHSGTRMLKTWDRIAARLVQLGSEWRMGGGVLLFQREEAELAADALKRIQRELPGDLREYAQAAGLSDAGQLDLALAETPAIKLAGPMFTSIWLASTLDRALNPELPQLQNTDGDRLVMCTSRFPLEASAKATDCRKLLAQVPSLEQAKARLFNWVSEQGDKSGTTPPPQTKSGITIVTMNGGGTTLLGSIELKKGAVVLSTNSRERAARGEAMVVSALGALVGEPAREEATAEELIAESGRRSARSERKVGAEVPPEEARAIVHAHLDRHYRKTLDEPVPTLGSVSPREAVRSDAGRAKVVEWLKGMENHAARAANGNDPMASYDFSWIWRELGVTHLRA